MNIPAATLNVLKCRRCTSYLSRSPVYIQRNDQNDFKGICDSCLNPNRPAYRNIEYEAVAQLLRFPCKYQHYGCLVDVPFTNGNEEIVHETNCDFRLNSYYTCPILDPEPCTERVKRDNILQHCRIHHPNKVARSPIRFHHDISVSNMQAFLILFNEELFIGNAKICLGTGKMYHSVLYLGKPVDSKDYYFQLNIRTDKARIEYYHDVAPQEQGNLGYRQDQALKLDINIVNNCAWDAVVFKIIVKKRGNRSTGLNRTQSVRHSGQKKINVLSRTSSLRISHGCNMASDLQGSSQRYSTTAKFSTPSSSQHSTQDFSNVTALEKK